MNIQRGLKPSYNARARRLERVKRSIVILTATLGLCACCVTGLALMIGQ